MEEREKREGENHLAEKNSPPPAAAEDTFFAAAALLFFRLSLASSPMLWTGVGPIQIPMNKSPISIH